MSETGKEDGSEAGCSSTIFMLPARDRDMFTQGHQVARQVNRGGRKSRDQAIQNVRLVDKSRSSSKAVGSLGLLWARRVAVVPHQTARAKEKAHLTSEQEQETRLGDASSSLATYSRPTLFSSRVRASMTCSCSVTIAADAYLPSRSGRHQKPQLRMRQ